MNKNYSFVQPTKLEKLWSNSKNGVHSLIIITGYAFTRY